MTAIWSFWLTPKIEPVLSITVVHNPTKFHENRLKTFCVILLTDKRQHRKHYLFGGRGDKNSQNTTRRNYNTRWTIENGNIRSRPTLIYTARRSYASAVLGVVILSVRPSVCRSVTRVLCDKTKQYSTLQIIWTTRKSNYSSFLTPTVVDGQRQLLSEMSEICAQGDPPVRKTPTSTDFRL